MVQPFFRAACKTSGHDDRGRDTCRASDTSCGNNREEGGMAGKFGLYKDAKGKFRFRLKAGKGEIIAVGGAYDSKGRAKNGIASVQKNAPDAAVVDLMEKRSMPRSKKIYKI